MGRSPVRPVILIIIIRNRNVSRNDRDARVGGRIIERAVRFGRFGVFLRHVSPHHEVRKPIIV